MGRSSHKSFQKGYSEEIFSGQVNVQTPSLSFFEKQLWMILRFSSWNSCALDIVPPARPAPASLRASSAGRRNLEAEESLGGNPRGCSRLLIIVIVGGAAHPGLEAPLDMNRCRKLMQIIRAARKYGLTGLSQTSRPAGGESSAGFVPSSHRLGMERLGAVAGASGGGH